MYILCEAQATERYRDLEFSHWIPSAVGELSRGVNRPTPARRRDREFALNEQCPGLDFSAYNPIRGYFFEASATAEATFRFAFTASQSITLKNASI